MVELFQLKPEPTPLTYTVVEQNLNWIKAQTYCEARGGRLAQPYSHEENQRIKAKLQYIREQCWFGLRKENDNQWQYTDGSTTGFTAWGHGRGDIFIQLIIHEKHFKIVIFSILNKIS